MKSKNHESFIAFTLIIQLISFILSCVLIGIDYVERFKCFDYVMGAIFLSNANGFAVVSTTLRADLEDVYNKRITCITSLRRYRTWFALSVMFSLLIMVILCIYILPYVWIVKGYLDFFIFQAANILIFIYKIELLNKYKDLEKNMKIEENE